MRRTRRTRPAAATAGPAATPAAGHRGPLARMRGPHRERGASSLELAGMLPLLLLVAMAAIQLGIAGYAVQQAGTAARAAARTASREETAEGYAAGGRGAMSSWTASRSSFSLGGDDDAVSVTVRVTIPSVVPGIGGFGTVSRTATMPRD